MEELQTAIASTVKDIFGIDVKPELSRPDEKFGDYASNVALQAGRQLHKNPRDIAQTIAASLQAQLSATVQQVSVAGPGFVNFHLRDAALWEAAMRQPKQHLKGQTVVSEYSDPNPFKVLHAGHLYTSIVGDAIANLLEAAGAKVYRVNFGGDVGLHVGKTLWSVIDELGGEHPAKLESIPKAERAEWMARHYVHGSNAYERNARVKAAVIELNKRVYQLHDSSDRRSPFAQIYWTCRQWSYDYFDAFYKRLGSRFDKYYPESSTAEVGLSTVKQHIGDVFEESAGAVIFNGEKHGLHTRVFINREGLPTYEAKDVGLMMCKWEDYRFDKSIIITGNEQQQYMAVVLKSIEQFAPELAKATTHLTHGIVKLRGGEKMSSRKGNILRAIDVLDTTAEANRQLTGNKDEQTTLAAVKYAFLKQRIGGDVIYDPNESVNVLGDSGPYLQYAHARARSILAKSGSKTAVRPTEFETAERSLVRKISEYADVAETAATELLPSQVATYLYELAQSFNRFYEHNRVLGSPRESTRLALTNLYADTLKQGLGLLNISAPDRM